jgi:hypothetical protein
VSYVLFQNENCFSFESAGHIQKTMVAGFLSAAQNMQCLDDYFSRIKFVMSISY